LRIFLCIGLAAIVMNAQERDQKAVDEIRQQSHPLESSLVRDYANGICQKLAAKLPDPGIPYSLELVSGGGTWTLSQEPLVLQGGYIFVDADQILKPQSEAEFVGLLAHAMAHAAGSHPTQRDWPPTQDWARFEFEADLLAIQTAKDAGYDPAGLLQYLKRQKRLPGASSVVFAPPPIAARVTSLETAIRGFPARTYESPDPAEFARIQAEVRRLAPVAKPPLVRAPFSGSGAPSLRKHK
jgi:predicted Zn-dependent protease